jgi:hypothetical protein
MTKCPGCDKECPKYQTNCSWECAIKLAKEAGGKVHCPNGLPIGCIHADGNMYEIEHGDHPYYKFPVTINFIGDRAARFKGKEIPKWDDSWTTEYHALIYVDEAIAATLYECNYAMWSLRTGEYLGGKYSDKDWSMDEPSRLKAIEYYEANKVGKS